MLTSSISVHKECSVTGIFSFTVWTVCTNFNLYAVFQLHENCVATQTGHILHASTSATDWIQTTLDKLKAFTKWAATLCAGQLLLPHAVSISTLFLQFMLQFWNSYILHKVPQACLKILMCSPYLMKLLSSRHLTFWHGGFLSTDDCSLWIYLQLYEHLKKTVFPG